MVTKDQLVGKVSENNPHLRRKDVYSVVDSVFEEMKSFMESGNSIALRGFGRFAVKMHPARPARNPATGEVFEIPAKMRVNFKPSKKLIASLNE